MDMLAARGKHQQRLGLRVHRFFTIEQQFSQLFTERGPTRFACHHEVMAARTPEISEPLQLSAFARAVNALQGDELTAHVYRAFDILSPHVRDRPVSRKTP